MSEVRHGSVSKRFGDTTAIDDLSLKIEEGEFLVLLGPTGAGKTTTLRLVAGLETPDGGEVEIGGRTVTRMPPAERDVAFVFQQYSLYPHYSVYDNMAFPLRAPGRKWSEDAIRKRVTEIAEMLRIGSKLENRATQLSGGEMQRVSIGRALVRSPSIFLMDEPLSSLDAKLREDLRVELKRIQRELGATILYVTHDQLEAMTLADRIGILAQGRLEQLGGPREVYERPSSIYAAQRLGSPPVNIIDPKALNLKQVPGAARNAGVRPEDVELNASSGTSARVLTVEHLGAESTVLLDANGTRLHALLGSDRNVHEGDTTRIAVHPGKTMFFDECGARIVDGVEGETGV